MLRAVLSVPEFERVVSHHPVTYFGEKFPSRTEGPAGKVDFAVIRFSAAETNGHWQPGYYRLDSDLNQLNNALRELAR